MYQLPYLTYIDIESLLFISERSEDAVLVLELYTRVNIGLRR